jgi:aryl-alcohol dehydrogenase-like predicted oxidoreductase
MRAMRQRALGTATTSAIGCSVSFAVSARRGVGPNDVERVLHAALELGITLVDVAAESDAERCAGDAVRALRLRDRAIVATRVPEVAPLGDVAVRLPPRYVQERVEASLRATKLDALQLVQLPLTAAARASRAWPELAGTCARLVREGKVMQWGVLVEDADGYITREPPPPPAPSSPKPAPSGLIISLADAVAAPPPVADPQPRFVYDGEPWLVAIGAPLSLCERASEPLLTATAPVLASAPLSAGALAGALGPGVTLRLTDDRRALDDTRLTRIATLVAQLAPLVRTEPPAATSCEAARAARERAKRKRDPEATTVAELALRRLLDRGAVPLPRLHHRDHVIDTVAAALAPPLSSDTHADLDHLLDT